MTSWQYHEMNNSSLRVVEIMPVKDVITFSIYFKPLSFSCHTFSLTFAIYLKLASEGSETSTRGELSAI